MKKVLAIMLVALMVMSLIACAKPEPTPEPEPEPVAETTPEPAPVVETTPEPEPEPEPTPEPEPEPVVLADEGHALWTILGQQLLPDGTQNGWGDKDAEVFEKSALTAIALEDLKEISEDVYNALAEKDVKYLYVGDIIVGTNDAGWSTGCLIDGKVHKANGSYAIKVGPCTVEVDGDLKVYSVDQWISDPKTAHVENLTPATFFMPVWQEEKDENGFSWGDNPVVIGGAGLYTVVVAQYNNASTAEEPGYGMALVLKDAMEGIDYIGEFIPADHTFGIVGGFEASGWADGKDIEMTADGENVWKGEVDLKANDEFKVRADGKWDFSWGDPTTENGNCRAEADGTYIVTITFTDGEGVVTVEPKA